MKLCLIPLTCINYHTGITIIQKNYLVQTRSQARSSGITLPEVHGMGKNLYPNIKPEKQHANPIKSIIEKPCIGQGRAGLKRKKPDPIIQTIITPLKLS